MKKHICTLLAAAMMCSMASCGDKVSNTASAPEETSVPETAADEAVSEPTEEISTESDTWVPLVTVRERDIVSTDELYDYEIYEGGAIITKYKGNDSVVEVPAEIGGAPVTEIGFYAFEAKYDLEEVYLPDTVTTIGEFAFSDCAALNVISIPPQLREIQRGAFAACTSLREITLPATVERVMEEAFTGCASLTAIYVQNPELAYEAWGIEELPLIVYADEGTPVAEWASAMGKY